MRSETVEAEKAKRIGALTESFKSWGWDWDAKIPAEISRWGEFACTDQNFSLKIRSPGNPDVTTEVTLRSEVKSSYFQNPVKHLTFRYGWGGLNLQISAFPIGKMQLLSPGQEGGIGDPTKKRLLIEATRPRMRIVIDSDGGISF